MSVISRSSELKINEQVMKVEDIVAVLKDLPSSEIVAFFNERGMNMPRKVRMNALHKVLDSKVKKEEFQKAFTDEMRYRIKWIKTFCEHQLEGVLTLITNAEIYNEYRETLWLMFLKLHDELKIDDESLAKLYENARGFKQATKESVTDFQRGIDSLFYDERGEVDGLDYDTFRTVLSKSSTGNELRDLGAKYGIDVPRRIKKEELAEIIIDAVGASGQLSQEEQDKIKKMSVQQLQRYAKVNKIKASIELKKEDIIEYIISRVETEVQKSYVNLSVLDIKTEDDIEEEEPVVEEVAEPVVEETPAEQPKQEDNAQISKLMEMVLNLQQQISDQNEAKKSEEIARAEEAARLAEEEKNRLAEEKAAAEEAARLAEEEKNRLAEDAAAQQAAHEEALAAQQAAHEEELAQQAAKAEEEKNKAAEDARAAAEAEAQAAEEARLAAEAEAQAIAEEEARLAAEAEAQAAAEEEARLAEEQAAAEEEARLAEEQAAAEEAARLAEEQAAAEEAARLAELQAKDDEINALKEENAALRENNLGDGEFVIPLFDDYEEKEEAPAEEEAPIEEPSFDESLFDNAEEEAPAEEAAAIEEEVTIEEEAPAEEAPAEEEADDLIKFEDIGEDFTMEDEDEEGSIKLEDIEDFDVNVKLDDAPSYQTADVPTETTVVEKEETPAVSDTFVGPEYDDSSDEYGDFDTPLFDTPIFEAPVFEAPIYGEDKAARERRLGNETKGDKKRKAAELKALEEALKADSKVSRKKKKRNGFLTFLIILLIIIIVLIVAAVLVLCAGKFQWVKTDSWFYLNIYTPFRDWLMSFDFIKNTVNKIFK